MYLFEMLDEERKLADELKKIQETKQQIDRMATMGYPPETIKRMCRHVGFTDDLDAAILRVQVQIDALQDKIRRFLLGGVTA